MLAVHTPQGRTFLGPLEQLHRIEKLSHTDVTRRLVDSDLAEDERPKLADSQQTLV